MPPHSERVRRNYVTGPLVPDTRPCGLDVLVAFILGGFVAVVLLRYFLL